MKKSLLVAGAAISLTLLMNSSVFANAAHPCMPVMKACMGAGYTKGGAPGKSLMKDCVRPILAGKTVAGVNVAPADVQACQAKEAGKAGMMKGNM